MAPVYSRRAIVGRALILSVEEGRAHAHEECTEAALTLQELGYPHEHIRVVPNPTATEIVNSVREFRDAEINHSCSSAVVCIMAHGTLETIVGSDRHKVDLASIGSMLAPENCPALKGCPKIFLVQSCRNANALLDPIILGGAPLTKEHDYLWGFATTPASSATRGAFFDALHYIAQTTQGSTPWLEMLCEVNEQMRKVGHHQSCQVVSTLRENVTPLLLNDDSDPKVVIAAKEQEIIRLKAQLKCAYDSIVERPNLHNMCMSRYLHAVIRIALRLSIHFEDVKDLHAKLQSTWGKPIGLERWQMRQSFYPIADCIHLLSDMQLFGCLQEIWPTRRHYSAMLLFSGAFPSFSDKARYLQELWHNGVHSDYVFVLCGGRVLDDVGDQVRYVPQMKKWLGVEEAKEATEIDVANALCRTMLSDLQGNPLVSIISLPMLENDRRPNPNDMLEELRRCKGHLFPKGVGPVLAIHNQPYVPALDAAVQSSWLAQHAEVETVGPGLAVHGSDPSALLEHPYSEWKCNYMSMALDSAAACLQQVVTNWSHF